MTELNCCFCRKKFKLLELVVSSQDNKLFCAPESAPLEEGSCALKYIQENPGELGKSYFFIKLGGNQ
jgi:hypothetical protein